MQMAQEEVKRYKARIRSIAQDIIDAVSEEDSPYSHDADQFNSVSVDADTIVKLIEEKKLEYID
jgi:hypothetical protein